MMSPTWIQADNKGLKLLLNVQPGAKRSEIVGTFGERLKVRVQARAVDGAANAALLDLLQEVFAVRQSAVTLTNGASSRFKTVRIDGLKLDQALAHLAAKAPGATDASSRQISPINKKTK